MPEPSVLYTVVAVVLAGLVVWVAYVLKTAKEPWARKVIQPPEPAVVDAPLVSGEPPAAEATAEATAVASVEKKADDANENASEEKVDGEKVEAKDEPPKS